MKNLGVLACILLLGCGGHTKTATTTPPPTGDQTPEPAPTPAAAETPKPAEAPPKEKSLYERLGGQPAITAVIDEFVARTTTDDKIKDRFFNVDAANLKKLLVEFVCMATGGGCQYEGRDMAVTHGGMELTDDEFNALAGDLVGALDKFKVPEKEKGELLAPIAALKPQIVADPAKLEKQKIDQKKLDAVTKFAATQKDPEVKRLLDKAVEAGSHGQRNYAEQLLSRAEIVAGKPLTAVASTFRAGAPERITSATHKMEDKGPQPEVVGKDDEAEAPKPKTPKVGMLHGSVKIEGKAPQGLGVVMLFPDKGGFAKRAPKQRVIEQRNKTFLPHVMAVPVGSTVSFPNFDTIYHNVFSLSKAKAFDLGMYKSGETRDIKFDKPGIIRLGCNLHANMSAYIVVVDAPHYVVVDADGTYSFKALAPGKYKVQAWHEPTGTPYTTEVEVKEGDNSQDLDLKAGSLENPDKFGNSR
jgi:hemoglobin